MAFNLISHTRKRARELRHSLIVRHGIFGGKKSYSHAGEDVFIDWLLRQPADGFFVDIGAFHPVIGSNTQLFYRRGWRGINVDARREVIECFDRLRPKDINLHACVGDPTTGPAKFYEFPIPDLSTACSTRAAHVEREYGLNASQQRTIEKLSLAEILAEHRPSGSIDLLTVDVEGLDGEVLRSNCWTRFPANVVVFERNDASIESLDKDPTIEFMKEVGYDLRAAIGVSIVLQRRSGA